jgi:hypothetical protein
MKPAPLAEAHRIEAAVTGSAPDGRDGHAERRRRLTHAE